MTRSKSHIDALEQYTTNLGDIARDAFAEVLAE